MQRNASLTDRGLLSGCPERGQDLWIRTEKPRVTTRIEGSSPLSDSLSETPRGASGAAPPSAPRLLPFPAATAGPRLQPSRETFDAHHRPLLPRKGKGQELRQ